MEDKNKLILDNLGLVGKIAKKYCNQRFEYEDLFQTGCIGLIKAAKRYSNTNFKFSTYAYRYIYGEIFNFINSSSGIYMPRNAISHKRKLDKIKNKYLQEYNRLPTAKEYISSGIPANEVKKLESISCKCYSLEEKIYEGTTISDRLKEKIDYIDYTTSKIQFKSLLSSLNETEQKILNLRLQNVSIQSISKNLNISYGTTFNKLKNIQNKVRKFYGLSTKKQSKTKKEIAFELFEKNVSNRDIAIKLNANYNCITSYKVQWNNLKKVGA